MSQDYGRTKTPVGGDCRKRGDALRKDRDASGCDGGIRQIDGCKSGMEDYWRGIGEFTGQSLSRNFLTIDPPTVQLQSVRLDEWHHFGGA